jgi:hypothetical protein
MEELAAAVQQVGGMAAVRHVLVRERHTTTAAVDVSTGIVGCFVHPRAPVLRPPLLAIMTPPCSNLPPRPSSAAMRLASTAATNGPRPRQSSWQPRRRQRRMASRGRAWSLPQPQRRLCPFPSPAPLRRRRHRAAQWWGPSGRAACLQPRAASPTPPPPAKAACTGTRQRPALRGKAPEPPPTSRPRPRWPRRQARDRRRPRREASHPAKLPTHLREREGEQAAPATCRCTASGRHPGIPRPRMASLLTGAPQGRPMRRMPPRWPPRSAAKHVKARCCWFEGRLHPSSKHSCWIGPKLGMLCARAPPPPPPPLYF